jgi:hypothetical protein
MHRVAHRAWNPSQSDDRNRTYRIALTSVLAALLLFIVFARMTGGATGGSTASTTTATTPARSPATLNTVAPVDATTAGSVTIDAPPSVARADLAYRVTSNGTVSVVYTTVDLTADHADDARAPWSYDVGLTGGDQFHYVVAVTNGTTVTCSILRDGVVIETRTATGSYAIVDCTT